MDMLLQDLRYAVRQLARSPGFTVVAMLTLALGIGINSTAFSLVSAVLYRPLPVHEPDRLVRIWTSEWESSGIPSRFFGGSSWPDFVDLQSGLVDVVTGLAAYTTNSVALDAADDPATLMAAFVGGDFFDAYGVQPTRGRALLPAEMVAGATSDAIVITESAWRTHLGSDPAVLGRAIELGGEAFRIVGIVRDEELAPIQDSGVDVVMPIAAYPRLTSQPRLLEARDSRWLSVVGRLRPGVGVETAQAALTTAGRHIGAEHPAESADRVYTLRSASTLVGLAGESRDAIVRTATVLMLVVAIVLIIAGANLANLLLARATRRGREIAIRLALGASRRRVVRQLLTESVLLALAGASVALLLAVWATDALGLLPLPAGIRPAVDARVLAYTAVLAIVTGIIFGLAPALRGTRSDLAHALQRDGGRAIAGGRSRLRTALVAAQVALSFVLLVASGLLGRTVLAIRDADPGFEAERLLVAHIDLDPRRYEPPAARAMFARIVETVAAVPGVQRASLSSKLPFGEGRTRMAIEIPGYEPGPGESMELPVAFASPDWLSTLGVPLVRGAGLESAAAGSNVAVVNEAMARRYWPGRDPVGATFRFGIGGDGPYTTIVGVARDVQLDRLNSDPQPIILRPLPAAGARALVLHVRTEGDPAQLVPSVRRALRALDAELPLAFVRPLTEQMRQMSMPIRIAAGSIAATGALALLLATVGLYGVMAFLVGMRTQEIGIRIALGADERGVMRLVLTDGLRVATIGMGIGVLLALGATRALAGLLYGVSTRDPLTFAGIAAMLALAALAASWLPARRAAAVDPVVALRAE